MDNTPDGMFHTLDANIKGDMTWAQIVAMETNADTQNALFGSLSYILHPSLVGKAKRKLKMHPVPEALSLQVMAMAN